MSMIRFAIIFLLFLVLVGPARARVDIDMPKSRVIKIKEPVTKLVIDILPGRGVKCIFPWILDEKAEPTPARIVITNDAVFNQLRGQNQNAIEFKIDSQVQDPALEGEICDAFISVEGYHFVFTLRVNFAKDDHYSTILFELDDAIKYELINDSIRKARVALQEEFEEAEKNIKARAKKESLKIIAQTVLSQPKTKSVYETEKKRLDNGDRIIFKAKKILSYGDIHILRIFVGNDSSIKPLYINGIQIEKLGSSHHPLFCQHEIAPRVDPGEDAEGFVVTQDARFVDNEDKKLTLLTNRGEVALEW